MVFLFGDARSKVIVQLFSKLTLGVIYAVLLSLLSLLVPASSIRSAIIIIITYLTAKAYFNKSWLTTLYPTVLFFFFAILADIICGAIMQFGGIPTDAIMGDGFGRLVHNITCKLVHLVSLYMVLALVSSRSKCAKCSQVFSASFMPITEYLYLPPELRYYHPRKQP